MNTAAILTEIGLALAHLKSDDMQATVNKFDPLAAGDFNVAIATLEQLRDKVEAPMYTGTEQLGTELRQFLETWCNEGLVRIDSVSVGWDDVSYSGGQRFLINRVDICTGLLNGPKESEQ